MHISVYWGVLHFLASYDNPQTIMTNMLLSVQLYKAEPYSANNNQK